MRIPQLVLIGSAIALPLSAQGMDHQHGMTMPLSAKADSQIAHAKLIAQAWSTPAAAREAGYLPRFGDVPLQGEHYTKRDLVLAGTFDIDQPPVLMFIPIKGVPTLVGAAYAYEVKADQPPPPGFDGDADQWHEHPMLALPGKRLVMTHVWFIPSAGGPFAHDNPALPFLELGIAQPSEGWLDFAAFRQLAMALTLSQEQLTQRLHNILVQYPEVERRTGIERDSIRAILPQLEAAQKSANATKYRSLAGEAARHASVILELWKGAPTNPTVREILLKALDELLGTDPFGPGVTGHDHG